MTYIRQNVITLAVNMSNLKKNGMKKLFKKLIEMAAVALIPIIADWIKESLENLKKKIETEIKDEKDLVP